MRRRSDQLSLRFRRDMKHSKWRLINSTLFSGSVSELLHPPASQIPFLDGLRSIAILLVISDHLSAKFVAAYGPNLYSRLPFVANGWIGVDLFFVLSGFFIGGQLWKERRDSGSVAVGRFILRRGFRIWPLYFLGGHPKAATYDQFKTGHSEGLRHTH